MIRQVLSFGTVGIAATVTHVFLAYALIASGVMAPLVANLMGFLAAFGISFLGNAKLTFRYDAGMRGPFLRFLVISLVSLALTSVVATYVQSAGWPWWTYVVIVLASVPPATFLLSKFWVFASRSE